MDQKLLLMGTLFFASVGLLLLTVDLSGDSSFTFLAPHNWGLYKTGYLWFSVPSRHCRPGGDRDTVDPGPDKVMKLRQSGRNFSTRFDNP